MLAAIALLGCVTLANAQTVLIRGATVHTVGEQGVLNNADVLIRDGKIAAVGTGLSAPADATTVDAMRAHARSVRWTVGDRCRRSESRADHGRRRPDLNAPAFEMQWRPESTHRRPTRARARAPARVKD
jgi:hypothetical protein